MLACSAVLGALTLTAQLHAQSVWTVSVGASGAREIVHSRLGTAETRLSGSLFGGEAVATRRRFVARLRYGQGHVSSDTAGSDVVQGEALLGYKARPWLHVWLGPRARTFVAPGLSDRRWLFWSGGLSARGGIFPGRVDSFVEVWRSVSGSLNRPAASASGSGAELGLEARLPRRPWRLRFAYRIEQGRVDDGRRDTVEGFTLTAGYVAVR
jgi:hypothetical protein